MRFWWAISAFRMWWFGLWRGRGGASVGTLRRARSRLRAPPPEGEIIRFCGTYSENPITLASCYKSPIAAWPTGAGPRSGFLLFPLEMPLAPPFVPQGRGSGAKYGKGRIAQSGRAPPCQGGGCGFIRVRFGGIPRFAYGGLGFGGGGPLMRGGGGGRCACWNVAPGAFPPEVPAPSLRHPPPLTREPSGRRG